MTYADTVPGPDGRPLDQIRLTGVSAVGHHGVLPQERADGQTFRADVVLHLDTRAAATSDDLVDTVSYAEVAQDVHAVLAGEPVDLVETLVERIAAVVLDHPAVHTVDVRVHKPQAPIEVPFDDVEIVVRRDRVNLPAVASPAAGVPAEALLAAELADVPPAVPAPDDVPALPPVPAPAADAFAAEGYPDEPDALAAEADAPQEEVAPPAPVDPLDAAPPAPVGAVLALGANLGDPQGTLRAAVTDIDRIPGVQVMEVSPLARTVAVGPEQPDFLNAVLLVRTTLPPRDLLGACQEVELLHGRVRDEHWGPRTLDIDVITYADLTSTAQDLELPHPRAHERAFVLVPWAELDPDAVLGGLGGGPVSQLAATAPDRGGIRWLALDWLTEPASTGAVQVQAPADAEVHDQGGDEGAAVDQPAPGYAPSEPVPAQPAPVAHEPLPAEPQQDQVPAQPYVQPPAVPEPDQQPEGQHGGHHGGLPGSIPPSTQAALSAEQDSTDLPTPQAGHRYDVAPAEPWAYQPVQTIQAPQEPSAPRTPPAGYAVPEIDDLVTAVPGLAPAPPAAPTSHPVPPSHPVPVQAPQDQAPPAAAWAPPVQEFYEPELRTFEALPAAATYQSDAYQPEPVQPEPVQPEPQAPYVPEQAVYQPEAYQPEPAAPYAPERVGPPAYVPQPVSGPQQVAPAGFPPAARPVTSQAPAVEPGSPYAPDQRPPGLV